MNKKDRKINRLIFATLVAVVLVTASPRAVYAGTKIFGWDIEATYSNIKQTIMQKVFSFSMPQPQQVSVNQEDRIDRSSNMGNDAPALKFDPADKNSFVTYSFTESQTNNLIKTQTVGKNLGSGIVVKSANVEFLADNVIALSAQAIANNNSTKPIGVSAKLKVTENGTRLKIDSLNIDGMGVASRLVKPLVVKYLESQQEALIQKYAPADFAFVKVEKDVINIYLKR